MRFYIIALLTLAQFITFAQKQPCKFEINTTDSLGVYKETPSHLVYEKVFGNSSQLVFLSIGSDNSTPFLKLQIIQKSKDFIIPKCIDKNSRIYFQLTNGKIYTLVNASNDKCDNLIFNETDKENNRLLDCTFLFLKNDFEDLKKFPIMLMKIKLASDEKEYIISKELISEKINTKSNPESFFIDNLHCIMN
ncbi:hypothetical protein [Flavobacterium terrae]|uniref:Uncharacterized protein n=1 Tax=Flavobacterium terrae TaxID=415425 RepID=A0A1M6EN51_9FLAO|nr:hypothetical protein [Flavobacterium terrae]SHI86876.1 hypothetical protein SAMN05444363_1863 [Flavobacterium terrae]